MFRIIVPALFFLGSVIIGVFFLTPAWEKFQNIRAETLSLEEISAEFDRLTAKREELAGFINNISKEDLDRLEQIVPRGAQGLEYLVFLEHLAESHKLSLRRLDLTTTIRGASKTASAHPATSPSSISPASLGAGVQKTIADLPVQISATGAYGSLVQFLRALESHARITDVQDISLTPFEEEGLNIIMRLMTHYQQ